MERWRRFGMMSLMPLVLLVWSKFDLCASLNDEGRALLRFKERVELDPYGALANWNEECGDDPCFWFGIRCSGGRVVALKLEDLCLKGTLAPQLGKLIHMKFLNVQSATIRKLLQTGSIDRDKQHKNGKSQRKVFSSPAPAPTPTHGGGRHKNGKHPAKDLASPASAPSPMSSEERLSPSVSPFFPPSHPPAIAPSPFSQIPTPAPSPSPTIEPSSPIPEHHPNMDAARNSSSVLNPSPSVSPSPSAAVYTSVKHGTSRAIYISIVGAVSFLLAMSAVYFLCCRDNKVVTVKPWATGLSGQLQKAFVTGVPVLKRAELETACEDFSNIVGSLSDCMLYKGTLSSGVEIAVVSSAITCAKDWSKQSESQFRKKIMMLSKVNNKNFVNLLGYCEEGEPFTRMMVFEYAPNGTLFEHLHIREAENLDWAMRLRIAMGIAYCLEHIHQLNPPFILRNLDSTTIYLTDDYAAKISDLGFWSEAKGAESLPGNSGPLAPMSDTESIVYRFGIILLEILSSRLPFSEDGALEHWASCYLNGEKPLKDMMDPSLVSFHEESVSALCEVIRSCTNLNPSERPTMVEVARKLRDITGILPDGATPKVSPLWWAELEIITSEAS
ncbi:inactive receptor-like serine/threonine-protein kinase [Cocos nucifera]|uniref:Inactive receptor-like serine/threonine-protein kinase n=1 Tax=Cocos nucifera TaxID=13894 RepID=A0A8K0I6T9_COCNU|nr:inactive receptor-like serine/threonine-protein kinase [Cocos nucifera]